MTTKAKLRSDRLRLREKSLEDAWNDYQWRSDEELARLDAAAPLHMSFPEFAKFFAEDMQSPIPGTRRLAIDTLSGRHIGNCMYYDIDTHRKQAELGIMIGDRKYWDQGYGPRSGVGAGRAHLLVGETGTHLPTHAGMECPCAALFREVRLHRDQDCAARRKEVYLHGTVALGVGAPFRAAVASPSFSARAGYRRMSSLSDGHPARGSGHQSARRDEQ